MLNIPPGIILNGINLMSTFLLDVTFCNFKTWLSLVDYVIEPLARRSQISNLNLSQDFLKIIELFPEKKVKFT
jgi:hypothetical protein